MLQQMTNQLIPFEIVELACKNAKQLGIDLSKIQLKACITESFSQNELELINKYAN